jgi:hypothetical protein
MPQVLQVLRNIFTQKADRQTWALGNNSVVFAKPFSNTDYVLDVSAPDITVREVTGTRTTIGVTVDCSDATTEGYFEVSGESPDYSAAAYITQGIVQSGVQALTKGVNIITMPAEFADLNYALSLEGNGVAVTEILSSKALDTFQVISADANPDFEWIAVGN